MRKHIYLHCSNLEQTKDIREDDLFEPCQNYPIAVYSRSMKYEYGWIKTQQNFIHILVGNMPQEGCPWCASECVLEKHKGPSDSETWYCRCMACNATGPKLTVRNADSLRHELLEELADCVKQRFKRRRPWDDGLTDLLKKNSW